MFCLSRAILKLIAPHIGEKIDFAPGYSMASVLALASFNEQTVMDLQLRQKYSINLIAVKRHQPEGEKKVDIVNVPLPDTVIYEGDTLMVAGSEKDLATLPRE